MADHGQLEIATAEGNDVPAHEYTYERFTHLALIGSCHVVNVVLGLAIGAVGHHWFMAFCVFLVATLVALHGLMSGARAPSAVMVVLSLIVLALATAS
jgi:aa3 type cytochrome c oxidase subunit IV